MFIHNFKYSLITLFKNKMLIFWTFAFPIILGTLFYLAFSNIENSEKLDIIDIAIVDNEDFNNNTTFKSVFENLSDENNSERLFKTTYTSEDKAKDLLESDEIAGYLIMKENNPEIVVKKSGIDETILKFVTDEILETNNMLENVVKYESLSMNTSDTNALESFYASIYNKVLKISQEYEANIEDISSNHLSYTMIEYYTLIAMTCLYGGILGLVSINQNLANMSNKGKRIEVSPTKKGTIIFSSLLASYIIQLIGLALLFVYTIFVLKVDYGTHIFQTILLALVGSLAGLSLGVAIASLIKCNENTKTGIIISITMLGCFLSGMMGITMKYVIDKNVPIINLLNPASMITDGFYSLYYYDTFNRFYFNIASLLIFSCILIGLSIFSLRRQKYDSI